MMLIKLFQLTKEYFFFFAQILTEEKYAFMYEV